MYDRVFKNPPSPMRSIQKVLIKAARMNLYRKPVKMRWTAPSTSFQNSAGEWGRFQSLLNRR